MVDVGDKPVTAREAVARGAIAVSAAAQRLVRSGQVRKGNPLEAARLAGIMAAKRTSELIPLCHPIALTHVGVDIAPTRTRLSDHGDRAHDGADRRGDGGADGRVSGGAHHLRHAESRRSRDGDRRDLPGGEEGRAERALQARSR